MNKFNVLLVCAFMTGVAHADSKVDQVVHEFKRGFTTPGEGSLMLTEDCKFNIKVTPLWQSDKKVIVDTPSSFKLEKNMWHSDTAYLVHGKDTLFVLKGSNSAELVKSKQELLKKIEKLCKE